LATSFWGYFFRAAAMFKNHDEIYLEQHRFCLVSSDRGRFLDFSSMRFDSIFLSSFPRSLDGGCVSLDASEFFMHFKNLRTL
jgi:hypothetical protein